MMPTALRAWDGRTITYVGVVGAICAVGVFILVYVVRTSEEVTAAGFMAMVSSYVTMAISVVGLLIKLSMDERNFELKQQAEKRQLLDVAVRTISLLSTDTGQEVSQSRQAGALFTLAKLGHLDLAVMLVDQLMLPDEGLPGGTASLVLKQALQAERDPNLQVVAALMTVRHANALASPPDGMYWPAQRWNEHLDIRARRHLLTSLIDIFTARDLGDWDGGVPLSVVALLREAWQTDPEEVIRQTAANYLAALCPILEGYDTIDTVDGEPLPVGEYKPPDGVGNELIASRDMERAEMLRDSVGALPLEADA